VVLEQLFCIVLLEKIVTCENVSAMRQIQDLMRGNVSAMRQIQGLTRGNVIAMRQIQDLTRGNLALMRQNI
jgi:hypothetical protein